MNNYARVGCLCPALFVSLSKKIVYPNGNTRSFKISANPDHAAPESGIISADSPLGHALLGRTAGEELEYAVGRRVLKVKIRAVE